MALASSWPMSGSKESAYVQRTPSVHYQHRESTKATHYVLHTNSEVDETSDLIHSIFPQPFGLLSAVIESPDEAQWTAKVIMHLTPDHDFTRSIAETGETPILSSASVMSLLHPDVDLDILRHRWLGDSFYRVTAFRNKGVSHQRNVTPTAMMRLDGVTVDLGFADELRKVMLECEVRGQNVEAKLAGIEEGLVRLTGQPDGEFLLDGCRQNAHLDLNSSSIGQ